jgi:hypothetical protein
MPFDDVENKVERGSKLRIKASTFNEIQDVVKAFKRREFELKGQKPTSLIRSNLEVLVYNSIGSDLTLPFQVVKLKQPLLDISEDVLNANTRSTFISVTPGSTFDPIAITQVPIQDGEIDRAVINGVTIVKVKFTAVDHSWANPVNGETDFLESAELGQARILMDLGPASGGLTESGDELDSGEESGSGSGLIDDIRWCMVNLIGAIFAEDAGDDSGDISYGTAYALTSLDTWENTGFNIDLPSSGTYLIIARLNANAQWSAKTASNAFVYARLINITTGAAFNNTSCVAATSEVANQGSSNMVTINVLATIFGPTTIGIQGRANSGVTWTEAKIGGQFTGSDNWVYLSYVKLR